MENKEKFYCYKCGGKLVEHLTGKFDEYDGQPKKSKHCPHLGCEEGCGFKGHVFGIFSQTQCKRCGLTQYDHF